MSLRLYVGNCPSEFTKEDVQNLFRDFDGIEVDKIFHRDKKCFSFLVCKDIEQVVLVVQTMNNINVSGRRLKVRASDSNLQEYVDLLLQGTNEDVPSTSVIDANVNVKSASFIKANGNDGSSSFVGTSTDNCVTKSTEFVGTMGDKYDAESTPIVPLQLMRNESARNRERTYRQPYKQGYHSKQNCDQAKQNGGQKYDSDQQYKQGSYSERNYGNDVAENTGTNPDQSCSDINDISDSNKNCNHEQYTYPEEKCRKDVAKNYKQGYWDEENHEKDLAEKYKQDYYGKQRDQHSKKNYQKDSSEIFGNSLDKSQPVSDRSDMYQSYEQENYSEQRHEQGCPSEKNYKNVSDDNIPDQYFSSVGDSRDLNQSEEEYSEQRHKEGYYSKKNYEKDVSENYRPAQSCCDVSDKYHWYKQDSERRHRRNFENNPDVPDNSRSDVGDSSDLNQSYKQDYYSDRRHKQGHYAKENYENSSNQSWSGVGDTSDLNQDYYSDRRHKQGYYSKKNYENSPAESWSVAEDRQSYKQEYFEQQRHYLKKNYYEDDATENIESGSVRSWSSDKTDHNRGYKKHHYPKQRHNKGYYPKKSHENDAYETSSVYSWGSSGNRSDSNQGYRQKYSPDQRHSPGCYSKADSENSDQLSHSGKSDTYDNGCYTCAQSGDDSAIQHHDDELAWVSITNFPLGTRVRSILELFGDYHPIRIKVICNRPRYDRILTEVYVCFPNQDIADDVTLTFDNTIFDGRIILVTDIEDLSIVDELLEVFHS